MANTDSNRKGAAATNVTTPTDLGEDARREVSAGRTKLLADVFALFAKTKNFHWHVSGPHFRDYHLLLDDQAALVFAMIDPVAERARKLGGTTLRSIGEIASPQATLRQRRIVRGPGVNARGVATRQRIASDVHA
ncbi:starvation-inducible DNA-binding protein [Paraburkholderia lycopersici]|uniref:Starvation-inducible DNA-binding protein n=1 Tax=Paraburkholderia lycopersici TaxID=416944 RepID=A0A1G7CC05_9BURK|nr:starvation-inducible DNA-binding protein [Paraburkholderia lycopersici]